MTEITSRLSAALADRYRIEHRLGEGGMATVYVAHDMKHNRKVAVKVLRPKLSAILGGERFVKEIEVTANLQHPNILPLYDSGVADGLLYYVMPYLEGETLRDKLDREKQLSVEATLDIAKAVAGALAFAHARGVVHRDIKPANILLQGGQPVVADFGIALAVSQAGGTRLTETGLSLGTPHYMSPEQAMGDRTVDARSDVYSLGAMVYEMLVGDPPHVGSSAQAIVAKILSERPSPITQSRDLVPLNIEAAVQKAMAKSPADRFPSAAKFAEALADPAFTIAAMGVSHPAPTPHRCRWMALLSVAGVAIGFVLGSLVRGDDPDVDAPVVRFNLAVQNADVELGWSVTISPDGRQLVYLSRGPDGVPGLFRRPLDDGSALPIPGTEGSIVRFPSVSPDGGAVAYQANGVLQTIGLDGGGGRLVARMSPTSGGLHWGAGDIIVYQEAFGRGLMVVPATGGDPAELTQPDTSGGTEHRWPEILPDGKTVIFTVWGGQTASARLAAVSLDDGGEIRDLGAGSFGRYVDGGYLVFVSGSGALQIMPFDPRAAAPLDGPVELADTVHVGSDGSAHFAVSRTGTLAYFGTLNNRVPVIVDRSGRATALPLEPDDFTSPRFSPDGQSIALAVREVLWVFDRPTELLHKLTDDGNAYYPLWTKDGRILFSRDEMGDVNIYSVPADRSAPPIPVVVRPGQQRTQDLSADGRFLMVRQSVGVGGYDLMVVDLESASDSLQPWLVSGATTERAATFSHDGRWVAYASNESGRYEVYVRPFPGPGGRRPVSFRGGFEPAWSPDDSELYYRTGEGLMAVSVETGDEFVVRSRPRTIVEGLFHLYNWQRQWDVHPNGTEFVFLRNENDVTDLTVIVNWIADHRHAARR